MVEVSQLRKVNLNRLPVLWELLRCRNVSLAAANLSLTQSAVSAALKSLRELFDDDLLVPFGREFVLTERAQELIPLLEATLNLAEKLVSENGYDPSKDRGGFRISTADYVTLLLFPELAETLAMQAPSATVQVLPPSLKTAQDVKLGVVDLIIGPEQMAEWLDARGQEQDFRFESCFNDSLVGICRPGQALELADLGTYLSRPHASIHIERQLPASLERDILIKRQMQQNNRFLVPDFLLLPVLVQTSGMISVIPKSIATRCQHIYGYEIFDPPVAFPPLTLSLLWARSRESDLRLRWFLDRVREAFRRLGDKA